MQISILTLFPEMFSGPFSYSILKRAQEKKLLKIKLVNIRDFATDRHKTVDDRPYGGGVGMILRVDVLDRAIQATLNKDCPLRRTVLAKERILLLDPQGKVFNQKMAKRLAKFEHLILVCGHYEGVDGRVRKLVDEEISIGDYILTGGEIPAMVVADGVTRLIPGVLTKEEAIQLESFSLSKPIPHTLSPKPSILLEYPQYTRPPIYGKWEVPKILLSGNHAQIEKWRQGQARKRTQKKRPDLTPIQKG